MQTLFFTLIAFVAIIEYEQKFAKKDDDSQFYEVK